MLKHIQRLLTISVLVTLASCGGDLYKRKKKEKAVSSAQFATCELNTEAFSKVFIKDINSDLDCLHENLQLFMRVVRTDKPGFLSRKHLKTYIEKNEPSHDPLIYGIIDTIFDLNNLILADTKDYISPKNVATLVGFFKDLNIEFVKSKVWDNFIDENMVSYEEHLKRRSQIAQVAHKISARLDTMFVQNRDNLDKLDLNKFLENFQTNKNKLTIKKIKSFLFGKRIFLGGEIDEMTYIELRTLFRKFGTMATVLFDVLKSKQIEFNENSDVSQLDFLLNDINPLKKTLFYDEKSEEVICTIDEIINALKLNMPELETILKYRSTIVKAKEVFLESKGDKFTAQDVGFAFNLVADVLAKGQYFYRIYAHFQPQLESKKIITDSPELANREPNKYAFIDFKKFPVTSKDQSDYRADFARMAKTYRFFKGSFSSPYFADEIHRNPDSFFEIALLETVIVKFYKAYGEAHPQSVGGYRLTQEQIVDIIEDFKEFALGEQIVIPGREKNGAETATLMSSLFQYQSDGDSYINVNEATEFALSILTAMDVGDFFLTATDEVCEKDSEGRLAPPCFRKNFVKFLSQERKDKPAIGHYMPRLMNYFKNSSASQINDFIMETEKFARLCTKFDDGTDVPMNRYDMMSIFGGMINVEQTMARFDENHNNILDPQEVEEAYKVYENAIRALIPEIKVFGMNILQPLAKQFFLYLIKYKTLPDPNKFGTIIDFVKFLTKFKSQKIASADRMTIATILKTLAVESPANKENPFDCSTLR